jgi:hypothetical protein
MKQKFLDYIGKKHGRLTILSMTHLKGEKPQYQCVCDCGNSTEFTVYNITRTHSCGCYSKESSSLRNKTHGQSGKSSKRTKAYSIWTNMKSRCSNDKLPIYKYYGGRGINYCKSWEKFEVFLQDMGEPLPNMTLERIDVNGNYEASNCKWATMMEQGKNKNNNMFLNIDGEKIHLMEASRRYPVKMQTIWARIKISGWTDRQAVGLDEKPPIKKRSK